MRERTTWNREAIKTAAMNKNADPYTMNQDHVNQQPKADDYVIGTPSDFAEDATSPNRWEEEYKGGQVERNEIGMPEMRGETFNHPEKTAADHELLLKKSHLCLKVARMMLGSKATEAAVEDQAYGLMFVPDQEVIRTFDRLATDADGQDIMAEDAPLQAPTAQCDGQGPVAQGGPQQQVPVAQGGPQQQAPVGAGQDLTAMIQSAVQQALAQQMACQKGAIAPQVATDTAQIDAMVQSMVQDALAQQQPQGQPAPAQPQQQQAQAPAQVPAPPAQQQAQMQSMDAPMDANDELLLDTMLMQEEPAVDLDTGIELEPSPMDVGEVTLGPEDDVLRTLFANQEAQDAEQAQQAQDQGQQDQGQQKQAMTRTASTRTVGTRPTQGVSKVGGAGAPSRGAEVDKLAALWPSAPDVSEAFGTK